MAIKTAATHFHTLSSELAYKNTSSIATFRLRDAKARGFQRLYAFVVVTTDEMMLVCVYLRLKYHRNALLQLENYQFFINGLTAIIQRLQSMAMDTFRVEQSLTGDVSVERAVNRASYLPTNFFSRTVSVDTSRSLCAIVNKDDIFHILHRYVDLIVLNIDVKTMTTTEKCSICYELKHCCSTIECSKVCRLKMCS